MAQEHEREFWLRRLEATGRAQARYLWLVLLAGLFYAALYARSPSGQMIKVPVVDFELDTLTVLASGGPIIAFLVLVVMGAIRAWTHALEQIRGRPARDAEQLDTYPNAIDLAVYTTEHSPRLIRELTYFAYPLFLTAALIESTSLARWVWRTQSVPGRGWFISFQLLTWLPAALLVIGMWIRRFKQIGTRGSAA